jgi:hypothetical protein
MLFEAARDPGYGVATRRVVSVLLTNGERITGAVRVYRPGGHDRMSDWARQPETFRYIETGAFEAVRRVVPGVASSSILAAKCTVLPTAS